MGRVPVKAAAALLAAGAVMLAAAAVWLFGAFGLAAAGAVFVAVGLLVDVEGD